MIYGLLFVKIPGSGGVRESTYAFARILRQPRVCTVLRMRTVQDSG